MNDLVVDRSAERTFTPKHQKQFDQVFEQAKEQLRKQLPLPKYLHGHFLDTFEDEWNALSQRNTQKLLSAQANFIVKVRVSQLRESFVVSPVQGETNRVLDGSKICEPNR